jgi:hypothetical protein
MADLEGTEQEIVAADEETNTAWREIMRRKTAEAEESGESLGEQFSVEVAHGLGDCDSCHRFGTLILAAPHRWICRGCTPESS